MHEYSYGIIPLRRVQNKGWEVLIIQHHAGHWAFPKGHLDSDETPLQAAVRELKEETSLTIKTYLSDHSLEENYFFTFKGKKIYKTVQYFLAEVEGNVQIQKEEVKDSRWIPLSQAADYVTFPEAKKICLQLFNSPYLDFIKF